MAKVRTHTTWQRRGAPELRVVVDVSFMGWVTYTTISSGVSARVDKWTFTRQFEPADK